MMTGRDGRRTSGLALDAGVVFFVSAGWTDTDVVDAEGAAETLNPLHTSASDENAVEAFAFHLHLLRGAC